MNILNKYRINISLEIKTLLRHPSMPQTPGQVICFPSSTRHSGFTSGYLFLRHLFRRSFGTQKYFGGTPQLELFNSLSAQYTSIFPEVLFKTVGSWLSQSVWELCKTPPLKVCMGAASQGDITSVGQNHKPMPCVLQEAYPALNACLHNSAHALDRACL